MFFVFLISYQNHSISCSQTYNSLNCYNYDAWKDEILVLNRSLISYQRNLTILNQTLLNLTNQSTTIIDELVGNRTRKLARIETIEEELDSLEYLLTLICKELYNTSNCTYSNKTNNNSNNEENTNNNSNNKTSNSTSNDTNNNTHNSSNDDRANLSDVATEGTSAEVRNEADSSDESDETNDNENDDQRTKEFMELNKNIKNIQEFLFQKQSSVDLNSIIQNNNEIKEEYISSDLVSIIEGFISNHTFDQLKIWKIKILLLKLKHTLVREKRKILRNILRLNQTINNTDYEFDLKIKKVNIDISNTNDIIKDLKTRISDLRKQILNCDEGINRRKECDDETKNMTSSIQKLEEERKLVEKVAKLINYL